MKNQLNVVGDAIRDARLGAGLTQDQLAARYQLLGFDITRGTLAKIESGTRSVYDHELPFLAKGLDLAIPDLFPKKAFLIARKPRNPLGTSNWKKR